MNVMGMPNFDTNPVGESFTRVTISLDELKESMGNLSRNINCKMGFDEWYLVNLFICGLLPDIEKEVSMVGNNVGLRNLDVSWKDGVACEEIELRVSGMDGSSKNVEFFDESCEENVEESSEIRVNSNLSVLQNKFGGKCQELGIENIGVKNYEECGKENADVKGKENANVKGKEIECVDLILLDESEYFRLNVFNEFMCGDDEIKVKNSKSGDSKFLVTKDDGFVSDVDVRKLLLHKQNGSLVHKQKGFHLWGGYVDNQRYVEGWEDEDKDLNEFFVNKKQGEYFDKIKRKLSDVDAMNLEGNLGHLEFDIWKWLRRTKIDDTNCKCNHGKRKVDVWRWPYRKKERKGAKEPGIMIMSWLRRVQSGVISVVAVILYVQSLLGMEEGVTRLVLEVATTYRYGGLNDTFVSIVASMTTNPFEQTLFGNEHQWICEMNKFSMDSISGLCNFEIEYVGVQSDLNHDGGLVVCNQLVQNVQV
ncbi:hypothetical protein Tco_0734495 [Tanacetum coccineum]